MNREAAITGQIDADRTADEHVLSVLRLVSARLGLIRDEINDIGIALKNGRIAPEYARMLAEQAAPGCYEAASEDIQ
jgi:hypothetical protein